jgi:hypothetical protein
MSDIKVNPASAYPEPPTKKRNDLLIELIAGSVGGATQVLVGQVISQTGRSLMIAAIRHAQNGMPSTGSPQLCGAD